MRFFNSWKVTINATSWLHLPDTTMRACENITRDDSARLVSSNRERFAHLLTPFLLFQQQILFVLACIHPVNPRVPPRVLASCGNNYEIELAFHGNISRNPTLDIKNNPVNCPAQNKKWQKMV